VIPLARQIGDVGAEYTDGKRVQISGRDWISREIRLDTPWMLWRFTAEL
jgi:hypothetical protein